MHFPKLAPLQSRFAASLVASIILVIIYFALSNPHFAYAADVGTYRDGGVREGDDHSWQRLGGVDEEHLAEHRGWSSQGVVLDEDLLDETEEDVEKEGNALEGRATTATALAGNNMPSNLNIDAGETQLWEFTSSMVNGTHGDMGTGLPSSLANELDSGDVEFYDRELERRGLTDDYDNDEQYAEHSHGLPKRQSTDTTTVYISINTCLQPGWNGTGTQTAAPPQLTLYVSNTTSNEHPGPSASASDQQVLPLDEGFANLSLSASSAVYMAVHAPSLPTNFSGGWNYELAASIDGFYHAWNNVSQFLYLVDSDTSAALLVTDNLTQSNAGDEDYEKWMNLTTVPFTMFAVNTNYSAGIQGVRHSYCGLQSSPNHILGDPQNDADAATSPVQMSMITRGLGNKPKEQFYVQGLNGSSTYYGILAMEGNSTSSGSGVVGGGGQVWNTMNFTTKSDGNCALLFNLTFCSEVAYSVPWSPVTLPEPALSSLGSLYDSYASDLYQNFSWSLQQVPCNTTSTAQYSLAKNCTDCAAAYKQWLCAVTIPRCEDYSSDLPYLQPRNVAQPFVNGSTLPEQFLMQNYQPMSDAPGDAPKTNYGLSLASNSSRNRIIDEKIMPGPYKELLPCEDLCWDIVQSCPAVLGFGCPAPGMGLEVGYGKRNASELQCSYLGAVYYINGGMKLGEGNMGALLVALVAALVLTCW